MKKKRWISRILLYAFLIAAIAAAWVAVIVLQAPAPSLSESEPGAFEASVREEMSELLASRKAALDNIGAIVETAISADLSGDTGMGVDFENIRDEASQALTANIHRATSGEIPGSIPLSAELDETLNTADRLYGESISVQTEVQEIFLMESLTRQAQDHIRLIGYRKLVFETLGRDLIRYRMMDSLPLHEIKSELYREEYDRLKSELDLYRADVRSQALGLKTEIELQYDIMLDQIIASFSEELLEGDGEDSKGGSICGVLADIEARIAGFKSVTMPGVHEIEPGDCPEMDRMDWLQGEMDYTGKFTGAAGESGGN